MNLPAIFIDNMKKMLCEEFDAFMASYDDERYYGIRINNLKNNASSIKRITENKKKVIWCKDGYYCSAKDRPAKDAYYFAGSYYIQEPSAMTAASALGTQPGDLVIDLCAAPGGKSTQIASDLQNDGLLVSNDISAGRVKVLKKNLEQSGIRNSLIVSENPMKLADRWTGVFDRVIVDAPCSGEGMFRKDTKLVSSWENEGPEVFVAIQREILEAAHRLLKVNGELVYSTCTYNMMENEENIQWFMNAFSGYELVDIKSDLGVSSGFQTDGLADTECTARVWPHHHEGEGHFIAKLKKTDGENYSYVEAAPKINKEQLELFKIFADDLGLKLSKQELNRLNVIKDTLYLLPEISLSVKGLRVFSNGWMLGIFKKNRFEPSQAMACGLLAEQVNNHIDYDYDDIDTLNYLKGNTLEVDKPNGWYLVCVDGLGLGFGKVVNKRLKNKLEPSWRWQ